MAIRLKDMLCCATLLAGTGFAGTHAWAAPAGETVTRVEAGRPVAFDVIMPLTNRDRLEAFVADLHNPASPNFHHWLTPAQFGLRFGPKPADVKAVADALRARGFTVTEQTRSLHVTGTSDQVERSFATHLLRGTAASGSTHIMQDAALTLPPEIAATGATIYSFSPHVAHTHARIATGRLDPNNRYGVTGTYWFDDLKEAYSYPSVQATVTVGGKSQPLDGTGASIGVLISSDVYDADIAAVFDHENWTAISGRPDPKLAARVLVNGGSGPINVNSGDFDEASLDTQEQLTGAPGASVTLYNIPDLSDGSVFAGYVTVIESNAVDLLSSSFGECELEYTAKYNRGVSQLGILQAYHELFLQGNSQGITFLASSGDSAGKECPSVSYYPDLGNGVFQKGVSTPAADPAVTAVGGTNVVTGYVQGTLDSPYAGENGWTDPEIPYDPFGTGMLARGGVWGAGSGYSEIFTQPKYQTLVNTGSTTARAVPDVGMQVGGCPGGISKLRHVPGVGKFCNGLDNPQDGSGNSQRSAVVVAIATGQGGGFFGFIGTSVAAPELAGATALLIEQKGRMGNLNTYLYDLAVKQAAGKGAYFHTGIPGFNGLVNTNLNAEYGLTAGVGTPIVNAYVGAPNAELSGTPQTPSNP